MASATIFPEQDEAIAPRSAQLSFESLEAAQLIQTEAGRKVAPDICRDFVFAATIVQSGNVKPFLKPGTKAFSDESDVQAPDRHSAAFHCIPELYPMSRKTSQKQTKAAKAESS
jgi:hypothetical protein